MFRVLTLGDSNKIGIHKLNDGSEASSVNPHVNGAPLRAGALGRADQCWLGFKQSCCGTWRLTNQDSAKS